jgi:hypothetical protein
MEISGRPNPKNSQRNRIQTVDEFVDESNERRARRSRTCCLSLDHLTPPLLCAVETRTRKRKQRLRSRNHVVDDWLEQEDGGDTFADLEDFLVYD